MLLLLIVSIIWALSFGLTAQVSDLGAPFVAAVRLLLAALAFIPFLNLKGLVPRQKMAFAGIGALQFGLMYVLYISSFHWLRSSEVALFTVFTPVFVTLVSDLLDGCLAWKLLFTAILAVVGTGICVWSGLGRKGLLVGFLLMQGSNLSFALGQVLYRRQAGRSGKRDSELMGLLYLGAAVVAVVAAGPWIQWNKVATMTAGQVGVLLYLGLAASGLGFFLFNAGARRTDIGTLAIFNNLKIPFAILASGFVFREALDWPRLVIGGAVIGVAFALNAQWGAKPDQSTSLHQVS